VDAVKPGFTVIELMVSLVLTSVIMLVGFQLVAESITLFRNADRSVRIPPLALAMATVRRDIHNAAGVEALQTPGWQTLPLRLVAWDGQRVRLSLEGDALVRHHVDLLGGTSSRRVLMRGVTSWWWRFANTTTVDVRVTVLNQPDPMPSRRQMVERRTEVRRFVLRGTPNGLRW
jgi:prepilin-type N-terminal cleavage/methylation domain-containing protein